MRAQDLRLTQAAVFTVLVYVATIAVQIYQPATGGYFNVGESMIYLAALLSTPVVAGIAGGVGAALADLSTGYGIFAPGTLVIKFIEGYVAGILVRKLRNVHGAVKAAITSGAYTCLFLVVSALLGGLYVGPSQWLQFTFTPLYVEVATSVWVAIGVFLGALATLILLKKYVTAGEALSLATAGALMILGYFLYEYFLSNPLRGLNPAAAVLEVPVNFGQVVVGISVSLPIAAWLRRAGYAK